MFRCYDAITLWYCLTYDRIQFTLRSAFVFTRNFVAKTISSRSHFEDDSSPHISGSGSLIRIKLTFVLFKHVILMWINYLETWPDWDNMSCYYNVTLCLLTAILYFSNEFWSLMLQNKLKWNINHHSRALKRAISDCGISVKGLMIPYFIEYNACTSIVRTWISQWF